LKVRINVDCSPSVDYDFDEKCRNSKGALKAYTWNTKNSDGTGTKPYLNSKATMNMYLCNSFFDFGNLDDQINKYKDYPDFNVRYYLKSYLNRGE
jgi:hypothetical protein